MGRERKLDPGQLVLELSEDQQLEGIIAERVAERAERAAWRWRFRLIVIETVMLASLVAAAGLATGQPNVQVLQATLIVGASCLATGMLLIGLSAGTGRLLSRWRKRLQ